VDAGAAALALLNAVRVLARNQPVLILVEGCLNQLDPVVADLLCYVAARVDDLPVHMLAVEQVGPGGHPTRRGLLPGPLLLVHVDPGHTSD
jgi:hypothetical protein